jgi:hypothetical protein
MAPPDALSFVFDSRTAYIPEELKPVGNTPMCATYSSGLVTLMPILQFSRKDETGIPSLGLFSDSGVMQPLMKVDDSCKECG